MQSSFYQFDDIGRLKKSNSSNNYNDVYKIFVRSIKQCYKKVGLMETDILLYEENFWQIYFVPKKLIQTINNNTMNEDIREIVLISWLLKMEVMFCC